MIPHSLRGSLRCLLALAWALALLSGSLRAQNPIVDELPPEYEATSSFDAWLTPEERANEPRWSERVLERFADELSAGRHARVLKALAEDFRASPWPSHTPLQARFQTQLDRVAFAFADEQARRALEDGVETIEQRDALKRALEARGVGVQSLLPEVVDANPDPTLVDQVLVFFAGTPDAFATYRATSDDRFELLLPPALMRDLRLRAEAVRAVLQDFVEPLQGRAFDAIRRADRRWTNLLEHGYSQYPWESLFNGWVLDFDAFDPPDHQWILLHPTIGFEASTVSLDEITAEEVLNIELAGYVRYFGDDYESYFGGSIAATLRDDLGPGLGLVLHWDKSFSLGVAWHDIDGRGGIFDDPYVYMSFDVFRFVQGAGPRYAAERERLRALLPD